MKTPEEMREAYEARCTHFRIRGVVRKVGSSDIEFNGGINAAKRYVRENNLVSYNV